MDKRVKKTMICLFGILAILVAVLWISLRKDSTTERVEYINNNEWNQEVYPEGMPKLVRAYQGKLTAQNMGKSIYYFTTDTIPKYYSKLKNANDSEIFSYYNANSRLILIETGINDQQDFKELIASIQVLNSDELTFDSFRIDKDNIEAFGKYTETTLYITYQKNVEIGFNVKIYNTQQKEASSLVYTALKK